MKFKNHGKFDKRIRLNRKLVLVYGILLVSVFSLGIGYASFSTPLMVNGDAEIKNSSWNVHLESLSVTNGSVTASTPAAITNGNTVSFAASLDEPGDFYEFTVNVVNSGTMDAKLNGITITPTLTSAQEEYLDYLVTYSDDTAIATNDAINHGTSRTVKVRMEYKDGIDPELYSMTDQTLNISVAFNYVQK